MELDSSPKDDGEPSPKIVFRLRNLQLIELDMTECELLSEIRGLLSENPFLKLHPNYRFSYKGICVNEYESLGQQLDCQQRSVVLQIVFGQFTVRLAEKHIHECALFFLHPERYVSENFIEFNSLVGKTEFVEQMIAAESLVVPTMDCGFLQDGDLRALSKISFLEESDRNDMFFKKLCLSNFNAVPLHLRLHDEYFYLNLITKENAFHCISVTRKGVYVNESNEEGFCERPKSRMFMSLIDLLRVLSQGFDNDLKRLLSFDDQRQYDKQRTCPKILMPDAIEQESTFASIPSVCLWRSSLENLVINFSELKFGQNTKAYRDWNEEFQNCRALPSNNVYRRLQKTKILRRICDDFARTAKDVSRAVVENQLIPLNPSDKKVEECYVFNNLFVTFAQDRVDWEMPKSETSPSTYSGVNSDILNLQQIYNSDLESVKAIHTVSIDCFGYRVVVQAIVSGILHFDQKTWNCYGTIDDGKTINNQPDFAHIFDELCEYFRLTKDNVYKDQTGALITLHGSPEVKGIRAGDGRKYVMDLMRLSPRDANFEDKTAHECCVLRPELIKNFEAAYVSSDQSIYNSSQMLSKFNVNHKEGISQSSPKQPDLNFNPRESGPHSVKSLSLNPSLFTLIESLDFGASSLDFENLQRVAEFLRTRVLVEFAKALTAENHLSPIDMESLITQMHSRGINVRYLGLLYRILRESGEKIVARLIERTVWVRSLRKYIREVATKIQHCDLLAVIVRDLNLILGDSDVRRRIDQKISLFSSRSTSDNSNSEARSPPQYKSKKGKKKKKKHCVNESQTANDCSEQLMVTSTELFNALKEIAITRYDLPAEKQTSFEDLSFLGQPIDKINFLREFCRSFGLTFKIRKFFFGTSDYDRESPIRVQDIIQMRPKVKSPNFFLTELKCLYKKLEEEIDHHKLESALKTLRGCQMLIVNTYGIFNKDFVYVNSKIGSILALQGKVEQAIKIQHLSLKICERIHGLDHYSTGFAVVELSNYCYQANLIANAIDLHRIALAIFDIVGGSLNPDSLLCLQELQIMTFQAKQLDLSGQFLEELILRKGRINGETNENHVFLLGKLAALKTQQGKIDEAESIRAKQSSILKRLFGGSKLEESLHSSQMFQKKSEDPFSAEEKMEYEEIGPKVGSKGVGIWKDNEVLTNEHLNQITR